MAALVLRATNYSQKISHIQLTKPAGVIIYIVILAQQDSALTVADKSPGDLVVIELLNAQLTGEGAIGLVVHVLGRDGDRRVGKLAGEGEVDGRRGNDDLGGGIALCVVDVGHDGLDGVGDSIPARTKVSVRLFLLRREERMLWWKVRASAGLLTS
jgi:hypothetical protein